MSTRSAGDVTVLILIDWYEPAYQAGGPVQSISSLVHHLRGAANIKILTANSDLDNVPFKGIQPDVWISPSPGVQVYYCNRTMLTRRGIEDVLKETECDVMYINSFFSKFFSIIPLHFLRNSGLKRKVILAPRGMLGAGALRIKRLKKLLFIFYARLFSLHKSVLWHATSSEESAEILAVFPRARVVIIPNIPKEITSNGNRIKIPNLLRIIFISRISAKKNLLFALKTLAQVREKEIVFDIYGHVEDLDYWEQCQAIIKRMPSNISVSYKGVVKPQDVEKVLYDYNLSFLPTLNENYGHAIVESLLSGCPVLISDQTPWSDVGQNGAGFAFPLDDEKPFVQAIEELAALNADQFAEMSRNANNYIRKKINLDNIIGEYKKLFYECAKN